MTIQLGLSLMPHDAYRVATLPLFEAGIVDAIEWSFDQAWGPRAVPAWIDALLDHYAAAGRLWGHGVTMSPGSANAESHQSQWIARAARELARRRYRGVSEHVGFMTADSGDRSRLQAGAPLPVGDRDAGARILAASLARLADASGIAVGLENLAIALAPADVDAEGPMIAAALAATDGYLVLDLHNLWCRAVNFDRDPEALAAGYPLERVRCMHVSGGSWWPRAGAGPVRRDTHDGAVPAEVLALVDRIAPRCPGLEVVVLECIGESVIDPAAAEALRRDAWALHERLAGVTSSASAPVAAPLADRPAIAPAELAAWQHALVAALLAADGPEDVRERLRVRVPAARWIAELDDRMLAVAIDLVSRWSPHARG